MFKIKQRNSCPHGLQKAQNPQMAVSHLFGFQRLYFSCLVFQMFYFDIFFVYFSIFFHFITLKTKNALLLEGRFVYFYRFISNQHFRFTNIHSTSPHKKAVPSLAV